MPTDWQTDRHNEKYSRSPNRVANAPKIIKPLGVVVRDDRWMLVNIQSETW